MQFKLWAESTMCVWESSKPSSMKQIASQRIVCVLLTVS
jgi:hypothetical protein